MIHLLSTEEFLEFRSVHSDLIEYETTIIEKDLGFFMDVLNILKQGEKNYYLTFQIKYAQIFMRYCIV